MDSCSLIVRTAREARADLPRPVVGLFALEYRGLGAKAEAVHPSPKPNLTEKVKALLHLRHRAVIAMEW